VAVVSEHGADLTAGRIPHEGPARLRWLEAAQLALERDAAATRAMMGAEGWVDAEARAAYHDWLRRLVDGALDRGWPA
jgi:hypothetical protein